MTARYGKELRIRYLGDPAEGAKLLPLARMVVQELMSSMDASGIDQGARRKTLASGAKIKVSIVRGLPPIVEIDVKGVSVAEEIPPPASLLGIVVTPRNDAYPDGQDEDDPQALLLPLPRDREPYWGVQWRRGNIPGYLSTPPPKGLFEVAFPDGLRDGGNIDWRGPKGERLTWYGPASRYWHDPQEPNTFPRQWLFAEGRVLLDATAYAAEQEDPDIAGGIMGAALWRGEDGVRYLHVIHKDGSTHRLVRYSLGSNLAEPQTQQATITGYEKITTLTLADSRTPWFFSEDGSKAVHMTDPLPTAWDDTAPASCTTARLTISDSGEAVFVTSTDVRESPLSIFEETTGVIARDFSVNDEVSISHTGYNTGSQLSYGFISGHINGLVITLHMVGVDSSPVVEDVSRLLSAVPNDEPVNWSLFRRIIYVDLRSKIVLCIRSFYPRFWLVGDDGYERFDVELWRNGALVFEAPVLMVAKGALSTSAIGNGPWHAPLGGNLYSGSVVEGFYSPRLWMTWRNDYTGAGDQDDQSHRGILASCGGNLAPWKDNKVRSGWAASDFYKWYVSGPAYGTRWTFRNPLYTDGRGHSWLGVVAVESGRIVASWYLPNVRYAPLADSAAASVLPYLSIDTGRAANYLSRGKLPQRTGTEDANPAFYPGWPLGRSL